MVDNFDVVDGWKKFKQKYCFRKWLFNSAFFILLVLSLITWGQVGWRDPRSVLFGVIECPVGDGWCSNPVGYCRTSYDRGCDSFPEWLWDYDMLAPGFRFEIKPPFFVKYFGLFLLFLFGLAFGLNHWLNKRGEGE